MGWFVRRGRSRNLMLRVWFSLWAVAVALLLIEIVALAIGQPWGCLVWPAATWRDRHAGGRRELGGHPEEVPGGRGTRRLAAMDLL